MRKIKCQRCGKVFEASGAAYVCPECRAAALSSTVRERTCRECGKSFLGGPRAWYCPGCRAKRTREASAKFCRNGPARKLGSTDLCEACGKPYIVLSARQRYCKDCAKAVVADHCRSQTRDYMRVHYDNNADKKRSVAASRKVCVVCGALLPAGSPAVTCSPECAAIRRHDIQARADLKRGRRVSLNPQVPAAQTSGIPGITYHKRTGKWQLTIKGKYIGLYDTIAEAAAEKNKHNKEEKL